ncbi:MAG: thiamine pyrophosphate-requiring protein [Candidatus Binataceae bacterium]
MALNRRTHMAHEIPAEPGGIETVTVANTAQAYLSLLGARGVEYFFANGGTDFASIIDAFARLAAEGRPAPKPVTVPHEMVAASMAHGYYLVSGRPQVVMVHVTVGTANLLTAMMNSSRAKVPIIFTAGRTPLTEKGVIGSRNLHIHWAQESFDQGTIAREWTKWDYELRNLDQLETVVDRAFSIAMAEPRGPVYLTLAREVLADQCESFSFSTNRRVNAPSLAHPIPEGVEEAARLIAQARNPLIITSALGMWPAAIAELVKLAETAAIPVVEAPGRYFMNFPTAHPLHAGFDPHPLLAAADAILVVEADTPWFPAIAEPKAGAPVIHLSTDPMHGNYPIWGFPMDVAIAAQPGAGLAALNRALEPYARAHRHETAERARHWTEVHNRQRAAWRAHGEAVRNDQPLDPAWVSRCIDEVKDTDTICVNEYDLSALHTDFAAPGSYFGSPPAGGLGWGLGAALGVQLAAPGKIVICSIGDGAYIFGAPTAAHFVASARKLPVLFVIFNNHAWKAVRDAALHVHPDGWAAKERAFPMWDLQPSPHFEKIVSAFDGYGERVDNPKDMMPALRRALKVVREEKRQAVLNVICKYPA